MRVFIMMFLLLAPLLGHAELRVFSCEPGHYGTSGSALHSGPPQPDREVATGEFAYL